MYPNCFNNPVRWVCSILFVLSLIICSAAHAQRRGSGGINGDGDVLGGSGYNSGGNIAQDGWSLSLNGGYEAPLGDLGEVYKGTSTFGVTVRKRMGSIVYSGTVDYRKYKPKAGTITYTDGDFYSYTASYGKYSGVGLYAGIAYEVPVGGTVSMYGGLNGGYMLTKYEMSVQDDAGTVYLSQSASTSVAYIGPKAGFNFAVSDNVSIGLEARYSLGIVGANYNTREGGSSTPGFNSYAGNVFLTYSF